MSSQKNLEYMMKLDKCYNVLLQSGAGMKAVEVAEKLGFHRATVHKYLNTLYLLGKVESQQGIWSVKTGEQTIKPLEKEVVIELPMPKDQLQVITAFELLARDGERAKYFELAGIYRTILEKLRETRIIKIKGKNVDDLDLEKLGNLIQQANERSSKFNLKALLKNLRRPHVSSSRKERD